MQNRTTLSWKELGEDFKKIYINQHKNPEAAQKAWEKLSPEEQRATLNSVVENKEKQKNYSQKTSAPTQEAPNTIEKKDDVEMPRALINIISEYLHPVGFFAKCPKDKIDANIDAIQTVYSEEKQHKLKELRKLLTAILSGNPEEAEKIIKEDPSILLEKLEENEFVTAPSKHKFNLKPYQAALAVDDPQMAKMIKDYLIKLPDGKEEADKQFNEQCPKGWETAEEKKWQPLFDQHDKLADAIRNSKSGDIISSGDPDYIITVKKGSAVEKELLEFWRLLDATLGEVITAGKRPFNPNLLLKALELYDDDKHYKNYFGSRYDDPRALLFVQKVIGYEGIQRVMPVNDVQAFQDGLARTEEKLKNDKPLGRSTRFEIYRSGNWDSVDFYPLQDRGSSGFNFMIYWGGGLVGRGVVGRWALVVCVFAGRAFRCFCQSKAASLQNLCHNAETVDLSRQNRLA